MNARNHNNKIEGEIKKRYSLFFKESNIHSASGILKSNKKIKFPSYPYIGSKYNKEKILFVGLDMGRDEKPKSILKFEPRRRRVEIELFNDLKQMNTHIAGIFITTAYLLKRHWHEIEMARSYKAAVGKFKEKSDKNPLSYVALTNLHKFVTVGRTNRTGGTDRKYYFKDAEEQLLLDEIKIFDPRTIIFQSKNKFSKLFLKRVREQNKKARIIVAYHPSCRGLHTPAEYVKKFVKIV